MLSLPLPLFCEWRVYGVVVMSQVYLLGHPMTFIIRSLISDKFLDLLVTHSSLKTEGTVVLTSYTAVIIK